MSYLLSSNVDIFPSAKERNSQRSGRLLYEDNIANIIRQISDFPSFIITSKSDTSTIFLNSTGMLEGGDLEFCLYGYYIKIKENTQIGNTGNKYIQVSATLEGSVNDSYVRPLEIQGSDVLENGSNTPIYNGLNFSSSPSFANNVSDSIADGVRTVRITFTLFEQNDTGNGYKICDRSFYKFKSTAFTFDSIDGKHT